MSGRIRLRIFGVLMLVGACFSSQSAVAATDIGTLTVGHSAAGSCGTSPQLFAGYYTSLAGAYSPTGLTGGEIVYGLVDSLFLTGCSSFSAVIVQGFTANPGQGWLTSVDCRGVTKLGSGAYLFQYDSTSHLATWYWSTLFGMFGLANGTNISCTIVHN